MALAAIAAALAVLVVVTAHDAFSARPAGDATPIPLATQVPADDEPTAPVAPNGKPAKGRGHG